MCALSGRLLAGTGGNVFLVDLDKNSGINSNATIKDYYYANNVHPDLAGMDWITTCLISEIMEHSKKGSGKSTFHEVTYNLTDCFAKAGLPRRATEGQPLEVNLLPYVTGQEIDVTVTMKDSSGNTVSIPGGGTYAGGIMLMNNTTESAINGNMYIHITQTNVLFGYWDANGYNNSGISWETIASMMGSTAGADYRKETHVFRFVNVPNGTNNKIYLYVDGVQIGSMDTLKMIGTSTTHAAVSGVNISGKDLFFITWVRPTTPSGIAR